VVGWVSVRLGEILYEWNDLDGAWDHLARGLERAELGGDVRTLIAGLLIAGRVKLAAGDVKAATECLERVRPLLAQSPFPDWTSRRDRFQIELWLAQDRQRAAVDWAEATARNGREDRPDDEDVRLALTRVAIAREDPSERERALALLTGLIGAADADGRLGVQIEALALRAVALWQSGDRPGALTALERALRLAEPEGYVRRFADLGLPMVRLLQEGHSRRVMPDYVEALLAACGGVADDADGGLPDPLSPREIEVLRLIAAGLTNREIADALSISAETVKKHSAAIYGKLGAGNRTEAAARARALDLLD
jgi:LuxR family maltose regulon positive regulatory protein